MRFVREQRLHVSSRRWHTDSIMLASQASEGNVCVCVAVYMWLCICGCAWLCVAARGCVRGSGNSVSVRRRWLPLRALQFYWLRLGAVHWVQLVTSMVAEGAFACFSCAPPSLALNLANEDRGLAWLRVLCVVELWYSSEPCLADRASELRLFFDSVTQELL